MLIKPIQHSTHDDVKYSKIALKCLCMLMETTGSVAPSTILHGVVVILQHSVVFVVWRNVYAVVTMHLRLCGVRQQNFYHRIFFCFIYVWAYVIRRPKIILVFAKWVSFINKFYITNKLHKTFHLFTCTGDYSKIHVSAVVLHM